MCQVFPCASHFALQHSVWFDLIFQPYHLFLPPTNTHTSIFFVPLSFFHLVFHTDSSSYHLSYVTVLHRYTLRESHLDTDTQNEIKPSLPLGSCPTFSPCSTWPYCRRETDGPLAQNSTVPDTKSLSRSRCLLPLDICPWDTAGWGGDVMEGKAEDNRGRGWRRESFTVEEQWGSWKGRKGRLRLEKCKSKAKTQKKNLRANLIVNNTPIILNSKAILPQLCQSSLRPISMSA